MSFQLDGTFQFSDTFEGSLIYKYTKAGESKAAYELCVSPDNAIDCDCPARINHPANDCKHIVGLREFLDQTWDPSEPQPTKSVEFAVTPDGYAVDPETGEILGMVDETGQIIPEKHERFAVTTRENAEWVLSRMLDAESEIAGLVAKRDAICSNIDMQIKRHENKITFLHRRFDADLRFWAGEQLKGLKERSIKLIHGTLAFRRTPGTIKPIDLTAALDWARIHAPEAIQTKESLTVTPLKGHEETLPRDIFDVTQPSDSFSVKTGVKGAQ